MTNYLELFVLLNQSLYCYAAFPQIIANYKNKTGHILSDFYLMMLFNTYAMLMFYFFCLPQPVCYKLSVAIQFFATVMLVVQRFYYHRDQRWSIVFALFLVNVGMYVGLAPWAAYTPASTGNMAGWVACGLILINRIPQILHFYRTQSVEGFSPLFLVAFGAAGIMEMVIVLAYGLPLQTLCMAAIGFMGIMMMSYQYRLYRRS